MTLWQQRGYGQKKVEEKKHLEKFFRLFVLVHNLTHSLSMSAAVKEEGHACVQHSSV